MYQSAELLGDVRLFATPQTLACQAPLSMGLYRQEYWSTGYSPPRIKLVSPVPSALQVDPLPTEPLGKAGDQIKEHRRTRKSL